MFKVFCLLFGFHYWRYPVFAIVLSVVVAGCVPLEESNSIDFLAPDPLQLSPPKPTYSGSAPVVVPSFPKRASSYSPPEVAPSAAGFFHQLNRDNNCAICALNAILGCAAVSENPDDENSAQQLVGWQSGQQMSEDMLLLLMNHTSIKPDTQQALVMTFLDAVSNRLTCRKVIFNLDRQAFGQNSVPDKLIIGRTKIENECAGGGHFTALIRNRERQWVHIDSCTKQQPVVTPQTKDFLPETPNQNYTYAFMFYYPQELVDGLMRMANYLDAGIHISYGK